MKAINLLLTAVLVGTIAIAFAMPVSAQNNDKNDKPNPYLQPDNTWISISGTVDSVSPDTFLLDYGKGVVTVEMDDADRDADAYKLLEGDKVTVNGMVDDDLFETTTIEASSVYVEKLGTYFYASAMDEEDTFVTVTTPVIISRTIIQGVVTDVNEEEFTINTGNRRILVETDALAYDPLDDEGYQQIDVGDRVSVTGRSDYDLFEGREFVAESVITLDDRNDTDDS